MRLKVMLVVLLLGAGPAVAGPPMRLPRPQAPPIEREEPFERFQQQQPAIGAREAARLAQERNGGGRVLSVQLMPDGSSYRVKLLQSGDVRVVEVPAR